jgi:hypothetical protein
MMPRNAWSFAILAASIAAWLPGPAVGQSVFATRGLGYTIEPLDARARGLGGVPLSLTEADLSWSNPGSAIGLPAPGILLSYQYDNFDSTLGTTTLDNSTARFPLILAGYSVTPRLLLMAGYGSYLDQNWALGRADTLVFLETDSIPVIDQLTSEGGVIRLRAGAGYGITESLGVALAVDFYAGEAKRIQGRAFQGERTPQCCRTTWNYNGMGVTAGANFRSSGAVTVSLSGTYGGILEAEPVEGDGAAVEYELPISLRAGVSGRVGQATLITLGGIWEGWSSLDEVLVGGGGARDSWTLGGGLEWEGLVIRDRPVPFRIGGRTGALPFQWFADEQESWSTERAFTLGSGIVLAGGAVRTDFSLEFGNRSGDVNLEESFWGAAFSVRVLGR